MSMTSWFLCWFGPRSAQIKPYALVSLDRKALQIQFSDSNPQAWIAMAILATLSTEYYGKHKPTAKHKGYDTRYAHPDVIYDYNDGQSNREAKHSANSTSA